MRRTQKLAINLEGEVREGTKERGKVIINEYGVIFPPPLRGSDPAGAEKKSEVLCFIIVCMLVCVCV